MKKIILLLTLCLFGIIIYVQLKGYGVGVMPFYGYDGDMYGNDEAYNTEYATDNTQDSTQSSQMRADENVYSYYNLLNGEQKELYNIIYGAIISHRYETKLDMVTHDDLDRCFESVMRDHPEIYYVLGYTYSQNNFSKLINEFAPNYSISAGEMEFCESQIESYINEFMTDAPVNGSDYEKIKYIYEYVITHTEYDLESEANQTLYGAFAMRRCACSGYAKAVQYLANRLNLESIYVIGTAEGRQTNGGHAWNIVKIDGKYCHVDATWGDNPIKTNDGVLSAVTYDYLCTDDGIMLKNHFEDSFINYPVCDTLDNYYYVREGIYFDSADYGKIGSLLSNAADSGRNSLMIKCASYEILTQLKNHLITEQNFFNYVYALNVSSSEYKDLNLIVFSW